MKKKIHNWKLKIKKKKIHVLLEFCSTIQHMKKTLKILKQKIFFFLYAKLIFFLIYTL